MSDKAVLYGFDGSTYVRTVRMLLADKNADYDQIPVNVLAGEPRQPEHMQRHPFGKVPVLDIDGVRIRETDAICRYLDETRPGPSLIPKTAKDRARMNEAISLINSYGYDALVGVAGFHLFPDFIGGADEQKRQDALVSQQEAARPPHAKQGEQSVAGGRRAEPRRLFPCADHFLHVAHPGLR